MTQREKLIEILSEKIYPKDGVDYAEVVADFLIDRGVVVLPCKVGDTFYFIGKYLESGEYIVCDGKAEVIEFDSDGWTVYDERGLDFSPNAASVPYFTREEAEAALKKMEGEK